MRKDNTNISDMGEYTGEYRNGQKHGYGRMVWSNGMEYVGTFENDEIWGKGKFTFPDGSVYKGDVENGMLVGFGTYIWQDWLDLERIFGRMAPGTKDPLKIICRTAREKRSMQTEKPMMAGGVMA